MSYVYIRPFFVENNERTNYRDRRIYDNCWTVGFYDPSGEWHSESDHATSEEAAKRVAYLNGTRVEEAEEVVL